jgi:hypothetical protein
MTDIPENAEILALVDEIDDPACAGAGSPA